MDIEMKKYENMSKREKDRVDSFAKKQLVDLLESLINKLDASLPMPKNGYVIETYPTVGEVAVNDVEFMEKHYGVDPFFWKRIAKLKNESIEYLQKIKSCRN